MNDPTWVGLLSSAVLVILALRAVVATFGREAQRQDELVADVLAEIDCRRWDAEVES